MLQRMCFLIACAKYITYFCILYKSLHDDLGGIYANAGSPHKTLTLPQTSEAPWKQGTWQRTERLDPRWAQSDLAPRAANSDRHSLASLTLGPAASAQTELCEVDQWEDYCRTKMPVIEQLCAASVRGEDWEAFLWSCAGASERARCWW